ncbi:hypothetical protein [Nocardioides sp.]|uniref:hypothetical protein n=1 Tax=Nocardioides sp. TaxID=35761 RepID=UPI00286BE18F|nr:hypothetical protein [Nocardioides sp.]
MNARSVGAILAVALFSGSGLSACGTAASPAPEVAAPPLDQSRPPSEVVEVVESHAREGFEHTGGVLKRTGIVVADAGGQRLEPGEFGRARSIEALFAEGEHSFRLALNYSAAESEGDPERICDVGVADGAYVSCEAEKVEGLTKFVKVMALLPPEEVYIREPLVIARPDRLKEHDGLVWYRRSVQFVDPENSRIVSASEVFPANSVDAAMKEMRMSITELTNMASDPDLAMDVTE